MGGEARLPVTATGSDRGQLFDRAADDYATGRPGYPMEVFEILAGRCGLKAGARVLEVGPGSGQATFPLLQFGATVIAVEPGPTFAQRLVAGGRTDPG